MKTTVAVLALVGLSAAQAAAEPATLTLACQGTGTVTTMPDAKPEPISMGIIVNFTARTVQGFGDPGSIDFPVKITGINEVNVAFYGSMSQGQLGHWSIRGSIDRVTGDVDATYAVTDEKTHTFITSTSYSLKCRPTQRMF